jgi:NADH:ubiquinone oxidoreductase subunit 5 (subunit L)/multisubunit Na+/H+ antiporter MnhA subunit
MRVYTIKAALKTFVFSRLSDMFIFMAFTLTILALNTTDLSIIFLQAPFLLFHRFYIGGISIHFLSVIALLIALSGAIKGAQFFFHVWLPDAMEAPTPASALIHSSTLVIMGVYLILRFAVFFEFTIFTNYFLALLGALTIAFGAVTATFQTDIKKLVAFSTISQIGYLVCGVGLCCYEETLLYLIIHAFNKAFLFILVGYIVHYFNGNTDMRFMGGMFIYSFDLAVFLFSVCFNLAGLPLSAGFFGKEFLLFQTFKDDFLALIIRSCWVFSFFFTPLYMFILVNNVAFGVKKGNLSLYFHNWIFNFKYLRSVLLVSMKPIQRPINGFIADYWFRFQYSIFTSRLTTIVLFAFWCIFFFLGELLALILYGFSSPIDFFNYGVFFQFKHYFVFSLAMFSTLVADYIFFIVGFLCT